MNYALFWTFIIFNKWINSVYFCKGMQSKEWINLEVWPKVGREK